MAAVCGRAITLDWQFSPIAATASASLQRLSRVEKMQYKM